MLGSNTASTHDAAKGRLTGAPLDDEPSFLLARANARSLALGNAALAPIGLKVRSYSVLALAAGDERPSQRELAAFLRLDPSQVVSLVDELETRGLVTRVPDPSDRRTNTVVATAAGAALSAKAQRELAAVDALVFAGLDADDRKQLAALLSRVAFWD